MRPIRKRRKRRMATSETGEVFNVSGSFRIFPDKIQNSTARLEKSAVKAVEKGMKKHVAITANAPAWEK